MEETIVSKGTRRSLARGDDTRATAHSYPAEGDTPASPADSWMDEVSIWTYVNVLLLRRRLLLVLPISLAVVVAIISLESPKEYTASASFIPQDPSGMQTGIAQLTTQLGLSAARPNTSSPQFYVDLLRSRGVLRDVVTTNYNAPGDARFSGDLIHYFDIRLANRDDAIAKAVEKFQSSLSAQADRVTGVVRFEVSTRNPALSTLIAARLLDLTNDFNLRRRQSQARAEREFLERRFEEAKNELASAEGALVDFAAQNRRTGDSPRLVAEEDRLRRQVNAKQQLYGNLETSVQTAMIEEVRNTPVITVIDRPEGFVQRKPRGTVGKTALALFSGLFIAVVLAFVLDYLERERRSGSPGYQEFVRLRRAMFKIRRNQRISSS